MTWRSSEEPGLGAEALLHVGAWALLMAGLTYPLGVIGRFQPAMPLVGGLLVTGFFVAGAVAARSGWVSAEDESRQRATALVFILQGFVAAALLARDRPVGEDPVIPLAVGMLVTGNMVAWGFGWALAAASPGWASLATGVSLILGSAGIGVAAKMTGERPAVGYLALARLADTRRQAAHDHVRFGREAASSWARGSMVMAAAILLTAWLLPTTWRWLAGSQLTPALRQVAAGMHVYDAGEQAGSGLGEQQPGDAARGRDPELMALQRAINSLGVNRDQAETLRPLLEQVVAADKRLRAEEMRERERLLRGAITEEERRAAQRAIAEAREKYAQQVEQIPSRARSFLSADQAARLRRLIMNRPWRAGAATGVGTGRAEGGSGATSRRQPTGPGDEVSRPSRDRRGGTGSLFQQLRGVPTWVWVLPPLVLLAVVIAMGRRRRPEGVPATPEATEEQIVDVFDHPELLARLSPQEIIVRTFRLLMRYGEMLGRGRQQWESPLGYGQELASFLGTGDEKMREVCWAYCLAAYAPGQPDRTAVDGLRECWRPVKEAIMRKMGEARQRASNDEYRVR